jgi:beta-carotene/zeaxanthin 4-ketolase
MYSHAYTLPQNLAPAKPTHKGVWVGMGIVLLWVAALGWSLTNPITWTNPLTYLLFLLITHLYTGLFITAHDAMHGLVTSNKRLNTFIGTLTALLFAYNWYPRLLANHKLHHQHAATGADPDWHSGPFFSWYLSFARHYITLWQILAMAITYNVAKLWLPAENLIFYWQLPAILSTFQLFYFGTYLPHKGEHQAADPHKATSQPLNHAWAFFTCYFFGYHYEHHSMPWLPWYRLPAARAFTATKKGLGDIQIIS